MNGANSSINLVKDSVDEWILQHKHLFYKSKKSELEYSIMCLFRAKRFNNSNNLDVLYSSYFSDTDESITFSEINHFINSQTDVDYERIEKLVVYMLYHHSLKKDVIISRLKRGTAYYLLSSESEVSILSNRDFIYDVTHTIFWASIYGTDTSMIEAAFTKEKLSKLLNRCLSISILNSDVDVMLEVLACIFICKSANAVPQILIRTSGDILTNVYDKSTGHIVFEPDNDNFVTSYHATLVFRILLSQYLEDNTFGTSYNLFNNIY